MIKRKSLGWGKYKNLRGLGNYFPVEKSILKCIWCLFICKTLAGIQHHLHTGTGFYSFIASCSIDRLCDLGQMTSQFHVLCPCPPFNSSVGLDYELSTTRTVALYNNQMRQDKFVSWEPGFFRRIAPSQGSSPRGCKTKRAGWECSQQ